MIRPIARIGTMLSVSEREPVGVTLARLAPRTRIAGLIEARVKRDEIVGQTAGSCARQCILIVERALEHVVIMRTIVAFA